MNNKDLFNAINDIDEKFIEDAGKYLSDDDSDDPSRSEAIEIFPGESRFSPIKLVASLAAAAVLITGVTIAVRHHRRSLSIAPRTVDTVSGGNATGTTIGQGDGNTDSEPMLGTHSFDLNAPLPFEIVGPDNLQLTYSDVTQIGGSSKEDLTKDNWESITCGGFAYIAAPYGNNFNTIDHTPADVEINDRRSLAHEFKRIYVGDTFGTLTVTEASNTFAHETFSQTSDENEASDIVALSKNFVKFDGKITANGYIINDGDRYIYVFQNGEKQLPLVHYSLVDFIMNNEYESSLEWSHFENGIQYAGELPTLILGEEEKANIEPFLSSADYLKAQITLDNITMESSQSVEGTSCIISYDTSKVVLNYADSIVVTPFAEENEREIRSILSCARDISELKSNTELAKLANCDDIKVYRNIAVNYEPGEEITEGDLRYGMVIELRGSEGERLALYRLREGAVTIE